MAGRLAHSLAERSFEGWYKDWQRNPDATRRRLEERADVKDEGVDAASDALRLILGGLERGETPATF